MSTDIDYETYFSPTPINGVVVTTLQQLPGRTINQVIVPVIITVAEGANSFDEVLAVAFSQLVISAKSQHGDAVLGLSVQSTYRGDVGSCAVQLTGCVVKLIPKGRT